MKWGAGLPGIRNLTVALPKGRMLEDSLAYLRRVGLWRGDPNPGRALRLEDREGDLTVLLARSRDVATFVEKGAADIGIVGGDTLREFNPRVAVGRPLGFGRCRMILAAPDGAAWPPAGPCRIATKYPAIARAFVEARGLEAAIISLHGSVELAPQIGIADYIVDLTQTGRTLEENSLTVLETLFDSEAFLIGSHRSRSGILQRLATEDDADGMGVGL